MNEIWKPVVGYENSHEVSSAGRVKTVEREWIGKTPTGLPARRKVTPVMLSQHLSYNGYLRVALCVDGALKTVAVHRIVAEAFLGKAKPGFDQVNHIDGNKQNNNFENLEWSNASHNQHHAIKTGLANPIRGSEHWHSTLKADEVIEIRRLLSTGMVQRRIAEQFGVAYGQITMIKQGRAWKHLL